MKYEIKKHLKRILPLTMVLIFLLGAFAGCGNVMRGNKETTPSANAGQNPDDLGSDNDNNEENEDESARVFTLDSLEPLSKEKQAEVEAAWERVEGNVALQWTDKHASNNAGDWFKFGDKYYGTYNGCIVISTLGTLADDNVIKLGEQKLKHDYYISMYVYSNGDFTPIEIAYEKFMLSNSDVSDIIDYHEEMQEYIDSATVDPQHKNPVFTIDSLEPLSKERQVQIEEAWKNRSGGGAQQLGLSWGFIGRDRYYGTFGDSSVIFVPSMLTAIGSIFVAGEKITYHNLCTIYVYNNGEFFKIEEAYNKGLLTQSDVSSIARYHYRFEIYTNSVTRTDYRDYGHYEKCDVVFIENLTSKSDDYVVTVAGYEFKHNKEFLICAYAAGDIRELDWLYENGYLTAEDIGEIYKLHLGCIS